MKGGSVYAGRRRGLGRPWPHARLCGGERRQTRAGRYRRAGSARLGGDCRAIGAPASTTPWEMRGVDYVKAVKLLEKALGDKVRGLMIGQNG